MNQHIFQCSQATVLAEGEDCGVYQFRNETGEGTITIYNVFPGATLGYNDFHMRWFDSEFKPTENVFCIDHCREGRLEYTAKNNSYSYIQAGDLKLDRRLTHTGRFEMPLSHYHGAMVSFDMQIASKALTQEIRDFPVDLYRLQDKFCKDIYPTVLHNLPFIEHIFSELYAVPRKIKHAYFKVKILELLLYLEALEIPDEPDRKPYFYKTQVEKVKGIQSFLSENISENFTQEELSKRFDIPLTTMKNCFKSVFGSTIGAWLLQCRMNNAAVILKREPSVTIAEIAGRVGYDSPSKFAMAFKKVMGVPPAEYRKWNV